MGINIISANVFGDGTHESTQIVLKALEWCNPNGKDVLDIGTGTGIQSIYAKKMGAENVLAVDVGYHEIQTARENFRNNDVEVMSRLNIYNEFLDFKADITVANLPPHQIREFLDIAPYTMKEDGILICSWDSRFNIKNECDLTEWEIKKHFKGIEWDAYVLERL